jgi:glucose uptake protein
MILPGSPLFTVILLAITLLCWGSWANSLKISGPKWRWELFYYDFAIGAVIAAVIAAFTFGSMGLDGFTVLDDIKLAGKRQDAFALVAGAIFNLGNLLIVASMSMAGISVALPIGMGVALIVSSLLAHFLHPGGNLLLMLAGCAAILAAVVLDGVAWRKYRAARAADAQAAAAALAAEHSSAGLEKATAGKTSPQVRRKSGSKRRATTSKAIFLAVLGGILSGVFFPLMTLSQDGENGLGPYTATLLFVLGMAFSTFVYNLFFMNLPLQGAAIEIREYFNGKAKNHLAGIVGGMVWCAGTFTNFVAARAEGPAAPPAILGAALVSGAPVIAAVWGMVVWKEFGDAENSIRILFVAMLVLLTIGIAVISLAHAGPAH